MQPPRPPEGVLADGVVSLRVPSAALAAAMEIIDRDGADALSMRRLARALARDPMILYRHAPNKAALLDGVAETVLALLTRAGFSGPDALHIYRALFGFLHGHILDELQELTVSPDETDDLLRLGLHRLAVGDFPLLRGLAPVLAGDDGAAEGPIPIAGHAGSSMWWTSQVARASPARPPGRPSRVRREKLSRI